MEPTSVFSPFPAYQAPQDDTMDPTAVFDRIWSVVESADGGFVV